MSDIQRGPLSVQTDMRGAGGGQGRGTMNWNPGSIRLRSGWRCDALQAAHIWTQDIRDHHRAVCLLIIFEDCEERATDREPRSVQRMDEFCFGVALCRRTAKADVGPTRLEALEVTA